MASPTGTVERWRLRLSVPAALTIVGTIVGLILAQRIFVAAHQPLSWAAACVVAAVLLDPAVDRLAVHLKRAPAVLLTFLALGAVAVGTIYLVFDEVEGALDRLKTAAPDAAATIEDRDDRVGELARDFHLSERVTSSVDALEERVVRGDDLLWSTAGTAPGYMVCAILTVFLMTYGPRTAKAALEQLPDEDQRERIARVVGPAVGRARSAAILTVGEALVVGLAVTAVAAGLDLPAPSAIGAAAGVLSLFPHVGLTLGSLPLLLLTLGFRSLPTAVLLLVVVLCLQVTDSMLVRPRLAARSVDTGLLVPSVVALVAYAVYGVGGAVYATAYAIFALAVLDQIAAVDADAP